MALIDTHNTAADNGRVLAYDNSHDITIAIISESGTVEFESYESTEKRVEAEVSNTSRRASPRRGRRIRIGVESMDRFFSRMRANAASSTVMKDSRRA